MWRVRFRAVKLGFLGGGVVALSELVGYFLVPLLTGAVSTRGPELLTMGPDYFHQSPDTYHIVVLGIPAFLVTVGAVVQARRWELTEHTVDLVIVGGIFLTPVFTAISIYLITAIVAGTLFSFGGLLASMDTIGPGEAILRTFVAMLIFVIATLWALLLGGILYGHRVFPQLILTVGAGTLSGYIVARTITFAWRITTQTEHD